MNQGLKINIEKELSILLLIETVILNFQILINSE